jgi:hypothetical protein
MQWAVSSPELPRFAVPTFFELPPEFGQISTLVLSIMVTPASRITPHIENLFMQRVWSDMPYVRERRSPGAFRVPCVTGGAWDACVACIYMYTAQVYELLEDALFDPKQSPASLQSEHFISKTATAPQPRLLRPMLPMDSYEHNEESRGSPRKDKIQQTRAFLLYKPQV